MEETRAKQGTGSSGNTIPYMIHSGTKSISADELITYFAPRQVNS